MNENPPGPSAAGKIERQNASHYLWGDGGDGWHLLKTDSLSVIEEQMRAGSSEVRHHHQSVRQFFYVLKGMLSIEIDGRDMDLTPRQGVEIPPGISHRVFNRSNQDTEFLVISNPPSHGDRVLDQALQPIEP